MFVSAGDMDRLRRAEHLVFAVDGYFGDAACNGPSLGAVSVPLVRQSAVGFHAQPLHLKARPMRQHFVRTPRPMFPARIRAASQFGCVYRCLRCRFFRHWKGLIGSPIWLADVKVRMR